MIRCTVLILSILLTALSCRKEVPQVLSEGCADHCNPALEPVIFVPDWCRGGDMWTFQVQHFLCNGVCPDRVFVYDLPHASFSVEGALDPLDRLVDSVLLLTGAEKVHLVVHNAYAYYLHQRLADPERASKVRKLAILQAPPVAGPAGDQGQIPLLYLISVSDPALDPVEVPGARNIALIGPDRYQVAAQERSFRELFAFLYGQAPQHRPGERNTTVTLAGKCLTLWENQPDAGREIQVFLAEDDGGIPSQPLASFQTGPQGQWGPLEVPAGKTLLFVLPSPDAQVRPVLHYLSGSGLDNPNVVLHTFPGTGDWIREIPNLLPDRADETVLALFTPQQTIRYGRDILMVEQNQILKSVFASGQHQINTLFLFNGGNTHLTGDVLSGTFPFYRSLHLDLKANPQQVLPIRFNDRLIMARRWSSKHQGVVFVTFL